MIFLPSTAGFSPRRAAATAAGIAAAAARIATTAGIAHAAVLAAAGKADSEFRSSSPLK